MTDPESVSSGFDPLIRHQKSFCSITAVRLLCKQLMRVRIPTEAPLKARLAQPGRAPALQAGGQRFDPFTEYQHVVHSVTAARQFVALQVRVRVSVIHPTLESNSAGQSAVLIKRWSRVRASPFQPNTSAAVGRRTG